MSIFEQAAAFIERHQVGCLALVTVVETSGSTPRHPGARMLVSETGEIFHTIGGGRVEKEIIDLAREMNDALIGRVVTHHLVRDLAMCCGGSMTFLVEPFARSLETWNSVAGKLARRESVHLTSSISESLSLKAAHGRSGAWDGQRFSQQLVPRSRAILFGGGHIAQALHPLLRAAEFDVILCDDNELGILDELESELVDASNGTAACLRLIPSFELVDVRRELKSIGEGDYAIIVTRDHAIDQRLVEAILAGPRLSYVGLIGSAGKVGRFRRRVFAKGILTEAQWDRLEAPMGLDIGAETPTEIAISISARLIQQRARLQQQASDPRSLSSVGANAHRRGQ